MEINHQAAIVLSTIYYCCSCNSRYGYFVFGILSMAARLMVCISLYYQSSALIIWPLGSSVKSNYRILILQIISVYGGWVLTSASCLFLTLTGIVQKRSILSFPYIVILVIELIIYNFIFSRIISICGSAYNVIFVSIAAGILMYYLLWNLISLYEQMKTDKKLRYFEGLVKTV